MNKVRKDSRVELSLIQAVEHFSLTPVQKGIAKKLWKGNEKDTIEGWNNKFNSKRIINS